MEISLPFDFSVREPEGNKTCLVNQMKTLGKVFKKNTFFVVVCMDYGGTNGG